RRCGPSGRRGSGGRSSSRRSSSTGGASAPAPIPSSSRCRASPATPSPRAGPRRTGSLPGARCSSTEPTRPRTRPRPRTKRAPPLREALRERPKLLLTATPLQNELMELFGLMSFLDEQILGPEHAFKSHYAVDPEVGGLPEARLTDIRERLSPAVHRTLRRQV